MTKLNINRRNFLRAAGVTTGIGAMAAATAVATPNIAKAEYNQPTSTMTNWAITYLDEPSYNLPPYADADKLERFDSLNTAFFNMTWNMEMFGSHFQTALDTRAYERMVNGDDGFSLRDISFYDALAFSQNRADSLLTWEAAGSPQSAIWGKWEDSDENNSLSVKKLAYFVGAGAVGITELNRQWIYSSDLGLEVAFEDVETPTITDTQKIIPESMNRVVVIIVPMEGTTNKYSNTTFGSGAGSFFGYTKLTEVGSKVAQFIRSMGYNAVADVHYVGLGVPMAIDAGLGELGRHGLLINPEFGSNLRIGKVYTDMPLAVDKPITFGAADFCKTCMKCAENCPSKSISFDEEPSYDTYCLGNNAGMKKWYVNVYTCLEYWVESGTPCGFCQQTCTYSKPQTWVHDVIKVVTSKTTAFNSIFATMDDAFGYGTAPDEIDYNEINEWWADPNERPFMITKM